MNKEDQKDIEKARRLLNQDSWAMQLADSMGQPIEWGLQQLPEASRNHIIVLTKDALMVALNTSLNTLGEECSKRSNLKHTIAVGASGALGGSFGMLSLAIEIPISTSLILRSIADIARSEGENLADIDSKLACLEVFAFSGKENSGVDTGYYAVRASLAKAIADGAKYIGHQGMLKHSPLLLRFVSKIAERLGLQLSEKFLAQSLPVLGAIGGASLNIIFLRHFQNIARGHFILRRLERKYGHQVVQSAYEQTSYLPLVSEDIAS